MITPIVKLVVQHIEFIYACHGYTLAWTDGNRVTDPVFYQTGREGQEKALERAQIAVKHWEALAGQELGGNMAMIPGTSQYFPVGARKIEKKVQFEIVNEWRKRNLY
jgi:hypothetical protein